MSLRGGDSINFLIWELYKALRRGQLQLITNDLLNNLYLQLIHL